MVLSEEEAQDLQKMILAYLKEAKMTKSFEELQKQVKLKPVSKRNMLASKWRSIYKLTRQISDLEAKVKVAEEDLAAMGKSSGKVDASSKLPRAPAARDLMGHRDVITSVKFHPAYGIVASCGEDALIKIWDAETGSEEKTMTGHQDAVQDVAFNPKGTQLASCSADMSIKLWDTEEYKCVKTLAGHQHNVSGIVYNKTGTRVISCSRDKTIKVWDPATGVCKETLEGHTEWVRKVVVSPCGANVASCSMDMTVRVWDLKSGDCKKTIKAHEHIIEAIAYSNEAANAVCIEHLLSPERRKEAKAARLAKMEAEGKDFVEEAGRFLVSGSRDRSIKVWDLDNDECILELNGHTNWVRSVVFHPGGKFLLSCSDDRSIRVWDLTKKGECVRTLDSAHELFVSAIDVPPRLPMMASVGVDKVLKIWELK